jgi:acetyltransferase-like isoleucine patch superfamily enzyme
MPARDRRRRDRISVVGGADLVADDGVLVGYPAERGLPGPLYLGPGAVLRSGTVLYTGSRIGRRLSTGHGVVVREECEIGDDVSIWSGSVVDYGCRLGAGVKVHANCYVAQYSELEEGAFLAPGVSFANDVLPGHPVSADLMLGPSIGAGAQLGVNVTVLPFVRIGAGCVVGAGSVVTRDLPDGTLAFGNPARVTGPAARAATEVLARVSGSPTLRARLRARPGPAGDGGTGASGREPGGDR